MAQGLPQLSAPEVTAVTEKFQSDILVKWNLVPNAESYRVRITQNGASANNRFLANGEETVDGLMHRFINVNASFHHTVEVTAIATGYTESAKTSVFASPRKLLSESFALDITVNSLRVTWLTFIDREADFFSKSQNADLFFTIEDPNGNLIVDDLQVSTEDATKEFFNLEEDTNYKLRIVLGATNFEGYAIFIVKGEALEILFRTLRELPEPTESQISWAADETTLTVRWENSAEGVTTYDLTLTEEGSSIPTGIEVDARTAGSTTF
ncbi:MAG: hypothetical protein ACNYNY_06285, partial [Candidatus Oxydemutatoraceae bacterium WSBS_2016_MAG_OTU14]